MTEYNTIGMGVHGSTWQAGGYSGAGNVSELINSCVDKPAVVVGSARGVFDELEIVRSIYGPDDLVVYGVNDVGMYLHKLDHWVSLHGDNLAAWKNVRWLHDIHPSSTKVHTYTQRESADYNWLFLTPLLALSGYFAMQIAYLMGCSPIILTGCPGDGTPRFFEHHRRDGFSYGNGVGPSDKGIKSQIVGEMARLPKFMDKVRSMSGWTRDFFGGI